ncbi:MAG: hypothetical protein C0514_04020 [Candidatus Puniceispirillum sp.]|nr:hypothetical protein [Candidatus Puniceispirillum sp.]
MRETRDFCLFGLRFFVTMRQEKYAPHKEAPMRAYPTSLVLPLLTLSLLATPMVSASSPQNRGFHDLSDEELARFWPFIRAQQEALTSFSGPSTSDLPVHDHSLSSQSSSSCATAPSAPEAEKEYEPLHMSRVLTQEEIALLESAFDRHDEATTASLLGACDLTPWEKYATSNPAFERALQNPYFQRFLAGIWEEHIHPRPAPEGRARVVRTDEQVMQDAFEGYLALVSTKEFQDTGLVTP